MNNSELPSKRSRLFALLGLDKLIVGWQKPNWRNRVLWPLSFLYEILIRLRGLAYQWQLRPTQSIDVPVIVVGNLTVGGTGKSPLVIALVAFFQSKGYQPGVITRGYKAQPKEDKSDKLSSAVIWPKLVEPKSNAKEVGDEAVMIYERCQVPVMVGSRRVESAQKLATEQGCNIIISDDGFAHFSLERDIDIVVVDGARGFGNQWCLPSGPLREPKDHLKRAQLLVINASQHISSSTAGIKHPAKFTMKMKMAIARPILGTHEHIQTSISEFKNQTVHAIAGIGNPQRFFDQLGDQGINVIPHPFADHHDFCASDLDFNDDLAVLMTHKDAVKCRLVLESRDEFAGKSAKFWSIPVDIDIDDSFFAALETRLTERTAKTSATTISTNS